jgi:hypothetical protein
MLSIPAQYDPRRVNADQFLDVLPSVPWFLHLGEPHPCDQEVVRIHGWDECPSPESRGMLSLLNEHSAWQDEVFSRYQGERAEIEGYWERIAFLVWEKATPRVDYIDGSENDYPPNAAVEMAMWVAASISCCRLAGLKISPNMLRQWGWYVHGRWPLSYENAVAFPAIDVEGIPRDEARLIVF